MGEGIDERGAGAEGAPKASMRERAVRGSVWVALAFGYGQGVRLAGNLALAFLLRENIAAIGIMALVNSLNRGLQMASSVGLNLSVVQHERGEDPAFLNTAWTLQVLRGVGLLLLCCVFAWPYAQLYNEPVLTWLVPVTGLVLIAVAVQSPGIWLAERRLQVGRVIALDVTAQTVTLGTMLVWAYFSPTVWAMAGGVVVGGVVRAISSYIIAPAARPRFRLEREASSSMLRFGGWLLLGTLLTYFATDAPTLALGRAFTKEDLAVFAVAFMLATFSSQCVSKMAALVVFPLYSEVKNKGGDIADAASRVLGPLRVFAGCATAGMYAAGPMVVLLLWPYEYANAAWMVRLLAVTAMLVVLGDKLKMVLLSLGEARPTIWGHVAKLVALAVLMPLGAWWTWNTMGWGLPGFVAGAAASEGARYLTYSLLTRRHGVESTRGDLVWIAFTGVVSVAAAFVGDYAWNAALASGMSPRISAGVGAAAGSAVVGLVFAWPVLKAAMDVRGARR
ncbi:MAG: oligosaccharide flippase family protein [Planctomycetota bacterium]